VSCVVSARAGAARAPFEREPACTMAAQSVGDLFLQFDEDHLEWLVTHVLRKVVTARRPNR
jgi:hypothetical protein